MKSERREEMVVYLDLVFVLNALTDALAFYITSRLSGIIIYNSRLIVASLLGGLYGVMCFLPFPLSSFCIQIFVAMLLVRLVFGKQKTFLRLFFLFFLLSCTLGGAMTVLSQHIFKLGLINTVQQMNWKVFFLVSVACYFLLSVVFRGSAKHAVSGQLCRIGIRRGERRIMLDALCDTGNTLCDPYNATPIVTVWYPALDALWSKEEWEIIDQLGVRGSVWCAERLGEIASFRFRLVPYRSVGVTCAMLLTFQADEVCVDNVQHGRLTIALSPTPVSDGGGYTALWGGERKCKTEDVISSENFVASTVTAVGIDPTR